MVELALATGIPVDTWASESAVVIATALELFEERRRAGG